MFCTVADRLTGCTLGTPSPLPLYNLFETFPHSLPVFSSVTQHLSPTCHIWECVRERVCTCVCVSVPDPICVHVQFKHPSWWWVPKTRPVARRQVAEVPTPSHCLVNVTSHSLSQHLTLVPRYPALITRRNPYHQVTSASQIHLHDVKAMVCIRYRRLIYPYLCIAWIRDDVFY